MTLNQTGTEVLVVAAKTEAAEGVVSFVLRRPDGDRLPDWTPGARLDLVLPDGTTRQYSLHGDPREAETYRIAILREPGGRGGSRYVHDELREGDAVRFGGPRNNFRLTPAPAFAFVAGGIGITPILPMLRAASLLGSHWRLLYLGRSRPRMVFLDELAQYRDRVMVRPSDEHGPTDIRSWFETGPDSVAASETKLYACGPARLVEAVSELATERQLAEVLLRVSVVRVPSRSSRDEHSTGLLRLLVRFLNGGPEPSIVGDFALPLRQCHTVDQGR